MQLRGSGKSQTQAMMVEAWSKTLDCEMRIEQFCLDNPVIAPRYLPTYNFEKYKKQLAAEQELMDLICDPTGEKDSNKYSWFREEVKMGIPILRPEHTVRLVTIS